VYIGFLEDNGTYKQTIEGGCIEISSNRFIIPRTFLLGKLGTSIVRSIIIIDV